MRQGKSINELAKALVNIKENSRDFIVPTKELKAIVSLSNEVGIEFASEYFNPTTWAHSQISQFTGIPKAYYDKINSESPRLLVDNINHGFNQKSETSRLVRTVDGDVRALLSSRYRVLDAFDLVEAVYPTLEKLNMQVISSEITDQRMYLKCLNTKLEGTINRGDVVQRGLVISTSDVGSGSLRIEPLIYRLVCSNGMISNTAFKKYHVGRNQHEDSVMELLSDSTKKLSDQAFWAQVRDIVSNSMNPELFQQELAALRNAANQVIKTENITKVVEVTMKQTGISGEDKKEGILSLLASGNQGAGLTVYGLANSFTALAKSEQFSYEESTALERAGGQVIEHYAAPKRSFAELVA